MIRCLKGLLQKALKLLGFLPGVMSEMFLSDGVTLARSTA